MNAIEDRRALIAEVCDYVARQTRIPQVHIDSTALDNAARALVLALDGPPKPTTVINFRDLLMTKEFHSAFMGYARAYGLKVR